MKSEKALMALLFTLSLLLSTCFAAPAASAETIYIKQANFENYRTLQNGNTYVFTENIDFTAWYGQSAMTVADGANVVIEIAAGVTVKLTGGAANGATGAGAGIEVPSGAKLTIIGAGMLNATGGNAADGVDGGAGNGAEITDASYWYTTSGSGGVGGNGGGGAGAGIGGRGGNGGTGGAGAAGVTDNWSGSYKQSGASGSSGGAGGQGKDCGTVEIGGTVTIAAKGGSAAAKGGDGGAYSGREIAEGSTWYGAAYGGGGGGGGGGGVAASDIGGGGGGGGAGGGGGSGGICYFDDIDTVLKCKLNGDGGNGGKGSGENTTGKVGLINDYSGGFFTLFKGNQICPGEGTAAKINTVPYSSYTPGTGGTGGEVGARGGNGSLTVGLTASCVCGVRSAYNVGKISDTEFIRWENDKLWRVVNGVYTEIAYETVGGGTGNLDGGKWYVVKGSVNRTDSINVGEGEPANLVLLDCAVLTVYLGQKDKQTGIWIPQGRALNIFGVESGSLTATGGGLAAGIGGGNEQSMGALTIYGGTVSATGGDLAAGIGGGYAGAGGAVTINGGTVTATGGSGGAGIGGGSGGAGGSLTLGPRVLKLSDNCWGACAFVTFDIPENLQLDSVETDNGFYTIIDEGAGRRKIALLSGHSLTLTFGMINDYACSQEFKETVTYETIFADITIDASKLPKGKMNDLVAVDYVLPDGTIASTNAYPLFSMNRSKTMANGWYVVKDEVTACDITVQGEINLILADGAKLTVNEGIWVDKENTLTIYAQQAGSGELIAIGAENCAGIGGRNPNRWNHRGICGNIIINGGKVTVRGGYSGAGIGGGYDGDDGNVTINGGIVTATGGENGAGIGGGFHGDGGNVAINGGTVKATGGYDGAGIGGGWYGAGGEVTINGGSIKASSIQSQPKNAANESVWRVTVEGVEGFERVEGLEGCGTRDIKSIDGKVYLYLPNGMYVFTIDGLKYGVVVKDAATTATLTKTASFTFGEHIRSVTYTTEPAVTNGTATTDFTLWDLPRGLVITLAVVCEEGYEYGRETSWTVGDGKLNVALTADLVPFPSVDYHGAERGTLTTNRVWRVYPQMSQPIGGGKWYAVEGEVTMETLTVIGEANIILMDGAKLTVNGVDEQAGIVVTEGNALKIWGQEQGTGELVANGGRLGAGIGTGASWGGDIVTCGTVVINGGVVTANGGLQSAGIGGGNRSNGGEVTINGGTMTANGNSSRDGIGGGSGGTVTINGGSVKASSIGDIRGLPTNGEGKNVYLVTVQCETTPCEIVGLGDYGTNDIVPIDGVLYLYLPNGEHEFFVDGVRCVATVNGEATKASVVLSDIEYCDAEGVTRTAASVVRIYSGMNRAIGGGKWYAAEGEVTVGTLTVTGEANIILMDGAKLTVNGVDEQAGILVEKGNTLKIWGQEKGTGKLVANSGYYRCAGIGGGDNGAGGTVVINGGTVMATGGRDSAGIGGGYAGAGGAVTINGGTVTATGGESGAGIGGGCWGDGGTVVINGGMVMARGGGSFTAGIGGGYKGNAGEVTRGENVKCFEGAVGNDCRYVKIGEKPTCEGGEIEWNGAANVWAVTPKGDAAMVTITGLPYGDTVAVPPTVTKVNGVDDGQIRVKSGTYDITGAFTVSGGAIALNENGSVTIADETIPVKPTIGDLGDDAGEPFTVGEGSAAVTVRAIPGLKYELRRWETLDAESAVSSKPPYQVVADKVAEGASVTLTDDDPPADKAFYAIGVSVP